MAEKTIMECFGNLAYYYSGGNLSIPVFVLECDTTVCASRSPGHMDRVIGLLDKKYNSHECSRSAESV